MFTVHRVVTTAQTVPGNSFTTSSSFSASANSSHNESDARNMLSQKSEKSCKINNYNSDEVSDCIVGIVSNSSNNCTDQHNLSFSVSNDVLNISSEAEPSLMVTFTSKTISNYSANMKESTLEGRSLQNVIPTCVYLMSRIAVHMEIEGTGQCPSQVMLAATVGCEELGIANKLLAQSIFGLWMGSSLLEIQLKAHHRPYAVRMLWPILLQKYSIGNVTQFKFDEPMIMLKRSVFFSRRDEEKVKDHRILELLYEEAKHNVLCGRYVMEPIHAVMLGGIQARIELGPFNSNTHTSGFFREVQTRFLPRSVAKNASLSWLPLSRKNSAELKLLEQFKRVPQSANTKKLIRKYLEFCWALPFYGSAYFHGQVEQSMCGIKNILNNKDVNVLIAVNERGVHIIDPAESFDVVENGLPMSKLMQIFSQQASMIDALISHFTELIAKRRKFYRADEIHNDPNPIQGTGRGVLCNKLSRLTLASFDDEGRCIGQMGSISISY
ncbi:putative FERM domain-containing protein FRMD8P1 isoform X2 [Musca domestica]|uniref:FERM domain-containing protein 8 n=1 Tax=Musca domestica TaxID=7370 RepID=A0ABM3VN12_MUSDO|nr:putative FERM domain-containing protein FRMD8P1 isoform X2 [Musca domestica]